MGLPVCHDTRIKARKAAAYDEAEARLAHFNTVMSEEVWKLVSTITDRLAFNTTFDERHLKAATEAGKTPKEYMFELVRESAGDCFECPPDPHKVMGDTE